MVTAGSATGLSYLSRFVTLDITERGLLALKEHEDATASVCLEGIVKGSVREVFADALPDRIKAWLSTTGGLSAAGESAVNAVLHLHEKKCAKIASEGALVEALLGPLHAVRVPDGEQLMRFGFVRHVSRSLCGGFVTCWLVVLSLPCRADTFHKMLGSHRFAVGTLGREFFVRWKPDLMVCDFMHFLVLLLEEYNLDKEKSDM